MTDASIDGYAAALFEVARAEKVLGRVKDELFRFSRAVDAAPELRSALTDPAASADAKEALVVRLLEGRAHPVTVQLVNLVVGAGKARELTRIVDAFVQRATMAGEAAVAEVRVAEAMTEEQRTKLAAVLTQLKGRPVDVKVIIDATVLGGAVTTIGDEVYDGTVRRRLETLRANLTAG
ncbi:MAG: ATP synthase F1 subunit delta [Mycobacteriales bacterium]